MILENLFRFLILPSNLIIIFLLAGICLASTQRFKKFSKASYLVTLFLFLVIGSGPVSSYLMKELEYQYPKLGLEIDRQDINDIVILAGYAERKDELPDSAKINQASSFRIIEAAGIFHALPESRQIWISGSGDVPELMKTVLVNIGIPEENIFTEKGSADTLISAKNMSTHLQQKPFFLVTSAGHMPRAVDAFKKYQLNPIPAPTHFLSRRNILETVYWPTPEHLMLVDKAIYEYFATLKDLIYPEG
ncbi:MAG: YdcF family protein [Gammaproteobacteria bacterium]|nr:YdcF family protein [Gammaproteobacteria bacterium]